MPLYEYQCDACSHRFEVIQKFSDLPIATCPSCGAPVKKLPSSPAIQFKGSGWYITDYARAGKTDAGATAEGKGGASTEARSESSAQADSGDTSRSGDKTDSGDKPGSGDKAAPASKTASTERKTPASTPASGE